MFEPTGDFLRRLIQIKNKKTKYQDVSVHKKDQKIVEAPKNRQKQCRSARRKQAFIDVCGN